MMDKKFLLITQHFPPEIGAASNRMSQLVSRLQNGGFQILVLTTKPTYPNPKLYQKEMSDFESNSLENPNLKIYRVPFQLTVSNKIIIRLINQLLFFLLGTLYSIFLIKKYDIKEYITTSPPFLVCYVGVIVKWVTKKKWILEIRDLWPDSILNKQSKNLPERVLYYILKKHEYFFYKCADKVVLLTESFKDILGKNGINSNKLSVITNGIPSWVNEYRSVPKVKETDGCINICYIGNIGFAQDLIILLEVAQILKDQNFHFYFIGDGKERNRLIERKQELELTNVTFICAVSNKEELAKWYRKSDIGIVCLKEDPIFELVIPSKIFEYVAFNVPILYIGNGEGAEIIEKYGLGVKVERNVSHIVTSINDNLQLNISEQGKADFMNHFSWGSLIKKYKNEL